MITYDGKTLRNLQEQVEKNKEDILFILEQEGTLNQFGIKVIGQADTEAELPTVADYKASHADWAYGDTYAIGTESPYVLDVLTRANGTHPNDYWFNIGTFPLAGPKGYKGDPGIGIDTMQVIDFPSGAHSVTYNTKDGTKVHGTMDLTYMDGDSTVTENVGNVTVDIPIVYKNGLKADSTMNNDMVEVQVDFEKVVKKPATVASQNQAVVINNNGDSVGVAVQNSAPTSGSIAQRTADGCLKVADPIANDDAVSLAYLNAHSGGGGGGGSLQNNCLHTIQMNKATSKTELATSDYYFAGVVEFLNSKDGNYVYEENFNYILSGSIVIYASGKMYNKDGTLYGEVIGVNPSSTNPMIMLANGTISVIYFDWHCTDYFDNYKKLT